MDFNNYRVKNFRGDIEPHEVFLDKLAKTKEEEWGISQKRLEVPLQEKLVRLADVFNNTIINVEAGKQGNSTIETLKKIAKALNVKTEKLL